VIGITASTALSTKTAPSGKFERWGDTEMNRKADAIVTAVLAVCAVITTGAVVRREFFAPLVGAAEQRPVFIEDWRADLAHGVRMGPAEAPVQL